MISDIMEFMMKVIIPFLLEGAREFLMAVG
jgi:hypothetical protein